MQADRSCGASEGGRPSPSRSKASWLLGESYSRPERRTLVLLAATLALASANAATIGAIAPEVRRAFGVDNTAIGVLASSATAAAAIATVPFGILVDRRDRTKLLAITTLLAGVATMLSSLAGSFAFLFVSRVALGALTGAAGPGVASLLGDTFHESRRGRSYSTVLAGELLGAGVGFAVAGELAALDWRLLSLPWLRPPSSLAWFLWRLGRSGAEPPARGSDGAGNAGDGVPERGSGGELASAQPPAHRAVRAVGTDVRDLRFLRRLHVLLLRWAADVRRRVRQRPVPRRASRWRRRCSSSSVRVAWPAFSSPGGSVTAWKGTTPRAGCLCPPSPFSEPRWSLCPPF